MDIQTGWGLASVAGAAITAVVGFAVHLRTVKKLRLENDKLALEIDNLKRNATERDRMLVIPTTQEVRDIHTLKFGVSQPHENYTPPLGKKTPRLSETTQEYAALLGVVLVLVYLVYDIYRLIEWLISMLS